MPPPRLTRRGIEILGEIPLIKIPPAAPANSAITKSIETLPRYNDYLLGNNYNYRLNMTQEYGKIMLKTTFKETGLTYLANLFDLKGKTALVTGGASGIGQMIATALVKAGAHVMIASRKSENCESVAMMLNGLDALGSAEGFGGDVATQESIDVLANAVKSRTTKLDILFNNAGVSWGAPIEKFPHEAWAKVMGINVAGLFTLTRELLPLLDAAASDDDPARVINIGSVMGTLPVSEGAYSYSASKAAVHHLTKILADEFAARRITVNAIAPGPFPSRMTAFATASAEGEAKVGKNVPLGRIGNPDDIAGATLFLCGRSGRYVTGASLPLDGGMSIKNSVNLFGNLT